MNCRTAVIIISVCSIFLKPHLTYPQDDLEAQWKVCSPESLKGFSASRVFLWKKIATDLNVPIGIINASWGGTPAETWTPDDKVMEDA